MDRSKDPSKDVVVFRCIRSDGMQYDEARFPADQKPADETTVRTYCDRLGAMIAEQVYPGSLLPFTLEALPPFYQLRVRTRTDSKTRNDTFLYGYPENDDEKDKKKAKKQSALKCYRSTTDFFDHLLWLITDATHDSKNCPCKFCKPSGEEATASSQPKSVPVPAHLTSKARSASPASNTSTKSSTKKTSAAVSTTKAVPSPSVPQAQPILQSVAKPAIQPAAKPAVQPAVQPPAQLQPSAQPTMQPMMHIPIQAQLNESALFREGEIIWYRKQSSTFRLGIVHQGVSSAPTDTPEGKIKPLGHFQGDAEIIERPHADMRPFLTYSVPKVHDSIISLANLPMEQVQWLAMESELPYEASSRPEMMMLEASKIAASRVDHSYSLFNAIQNPNFPPNQLSFGGVFFGCEKIGLFEAVRVSVEQNEHPQWDNLDVTFVMVLKNIILEKSEQGERLLFGGDIWVLQDSKGVEHAPNQEQVPPAMRREKQFRDEVMRSYGLHYDWVLLRANVMKTEKSIKGRFYESQKLGPMLYQEPTWSDYLRQGLIPSIQKSLNKRLDSWGPTIGRVPSRLDALSGALMPGVTLSLGPGVVEPPRGI
ncbi:uncharacterized protein GGS22DRAFT_153169 [Annulohypoxylon maeteangense]|uniref:uncharacterized protein n=1 Tax=Annulohypoxylon maeteangense TaxID=1927788 RepID=UPI0020077E05|nr:uncharacterized protein GGS22DRAFT_153169 [Annulohypoxylon maeteangense]KAI0889111.1 hypothetical protein GGS22DRAFT_153169 [Annulohypoxylon maeteangense]